jgi:predicted PhzF superfamily epimerase YddE/YHI9
MQELLCFGVAAGGGNPALVIQHDRSSTEQRQQFAKSSASLHVCLSMRRTAATSCWTTSTRTHAARCACTPRWRRRALLSPQRPELQVRTAMHGQLLTLILQDGEVFIQLARQAAPELVIPPELPGRLLAAPGIALASPPVIASVGSPKLLLEVADSATLHALVPDLQAIAGWGRQHGVSGCYVWCRRPDGALEGRNLNHLDPAAEDGATGVAAGALTVHLQTGITLYQGANVGTPCLLRTELRAESILIGGKTEFA